MQLGTITDRIRKMLALAARPGGGKAEAATAMDMAYSLMQKYNLSRDDVAFIPETDTFDVSKIEFHKTTVPFRSNRKYLWLTSLAMFITKFMPTVSCYTSGGSVVFYGPIDDVTLAVELFRMLENTGYTYAMRTYGGWVRGAGGSFCEGFVKGLSDTLTQTPKDTTTSTGLMVINMTEVITKARSQWLTQDGTVKLRAGRGATGVGRKDYNAYAHGRAVGAKQSLNTTRKISG